MFGQFDLDTNTNNKTLTNWVKGRWWLSDERQEFSQN